MKLKDLLVYFSFLLTSIFVLLQSPLAPFANGVPGVDSSVFIYLAKEMLAKKVIYQELFDHKGPFLYFINMLGLQLSGKSSFLGIWLLEILFFFTSSVFLYKTIRLFYRRNISFLAVISSMLYASWLLLGGNMSEEWAMPFISIALYIFARYYAVKERFSFLQLFVLSAGFVCTFFLKSNMVVVWVIFGVIVVWDLIRKKYIEELLLYVSIVLFSFLISALPFILYSIKEGNMVDMYACYFVYNSQSYILWNLKIIRNIISYLLGFEFYISPLVLLYMMYVFVDTGKNFGQKNSDGIFIFHLGVALSILLSAVSCSLGYRFEHYFLMIIPLSVFGFAFWFDVIRNYFSAYPVFLYIAFVVFNGQIIVQQSLNIQNNYKTNVVSGVQIPPRETMDALVAQIRKHTTPNDKILVKGGMSCIYLLAERGCATKYPYRTFFTDEMEDEYIESIIDKKPKMIIAGQDANNYWIVNEKLDRVIAERYEKIVPEIGGFECWLLKKEERKIP